MNTPRQWETTSHCNVVSHWPGAFTKWSLAISFRWSYDTIQNTRPRSRAPYHGYAMRKILPLSIKTVTCKSKGFLCLFGHNSRIHCFCLKNLNLFSQNITFKVTDYLNLVKKIIRNWNVDEVSVPIISKDIRWLIFINPPWKELMVQWSEHIRLINSYQLLISGRCTNTGGKMKGSLWPVAACS